MKKKKRRVKVSKENMLLARLSSLEKKIDDLKEGNARLEQRFAEEGKREDTIILEEKKIESKMQSIAKEEQEIEKVLFRIGNFGFKKKHALELVRASAGAFLGVGLGKNLLDLATLGTKLAWLNVIGILLFVLIVSTLLIYKNQRQEVKQKGWKVVAQKLVVIYLVSVLIELFSLYLFGGTAPSLEILVKMMIIGSYSAMAGAVSFSLI